MNEYLFEGLCSDCEHAASEGFPLGLYAYDF